MGILLPAEGGWTGAGGLWAGWDSDGAQEGLEDAIRGKVEVAPAEDSESGGRVGVEGSEVGEEVAEGPAGVCGVSGGVDEGDGLLLGGHCGEKGGIVLDRGDVGAVDEEIGEQCRAGTEGSVDGGEREGVGGGPGGGEGPGGLGDKGGKGKPIVVLVSFQVCK